MTAYTLHDTVASASPACNLPPGEPSPGKPPHSEAQPSGPGPARHPAAEQAHAATMEIQPPPTKNASKSVPRRAKLTATNVLTLPCDPAAPSVIWWDSTTPAFGLRVTRRGVRTYVVSCRVKGSKRPQMLSLGRASEAFVLKEARHAAVFQLHAMRTGTDPREDEGEAALTRRAKSITLIELFEEYEKARTNQDLDNGNSDADGKADDDGDANGNGHAQADGDGTDDDPGDGSRKRKLKPTDERKAVLRQSTLDGYRYYINHYLYDIKDKPMSTLTVETCRKVFNRISNAPPAGKKATDNKNKQKLKATGAPIAANYAMVILRALVNFARTKFQNVSTGHYRLLPVNPVIVMLTLYPSNRRNKPVKRRVDASRIRGVYQQLKDRGTSHRNELSRTAADFGRFLILLALRVTQGAGLRWAHVDLVNDVISMPASSSKDDDELIRPISPPLHQLLLHRLALHRRKFEALEQEPPTDDWVFPSWGKTGHITHCRGAFDATKDRAGLHYSHQDLRRTLVDLAELFRANPDISRAILSHHGGVHEKHYFNNPELLRPVLNQIAEMLESEDESEEPCPQGVVVSAPALVVDDKTTQRRAWSQLSPDQLNELVWEMPTTHVAKQFGISGTAVAKRCKLWGIATPGRGYWQKLDAGFIDKMSTPKRKVSTETIARVLHKKSICEKEATPAASLNASPPLLQAPSSSMSAVTPRSEECPSVP